MSLTLEEKLKIPPNYQYKAITSKNFLQSNWHRNKLVVLSKIIIPDKNSKVLDIGTGSGNLEYSFYDKVGKIVGIDHYKKAVDFVKQTILQKGIKNVKVHLMRAQEIKKIGLEEKFDYVVISDVIEHLNKPDGAELLTKIKPLLAPRGKLIIITPNYNSGWTLIEKLLDFTKIVPALDGLQHVNRFTSKILVESLEGAGYKIESVTTFNAFSYLFPNKTVSEKLANLETTMKIKFGNLILGVFIL